MRVIIDKHIRASQLCNCFSAFPEQLFSGLAALAGVLFSFRSAMCLGSCCLAKQQQPTQMEICEGGARKHIHIAIDGSRFAIYIMPLPKPNSLQPQRCKLFARHTGRSVCRRANCHDNAQLAGMFLSCKLNLAASHTRGGYWEFLLKCKSSPRARKASAMATLFQEIDRFFGLVLCASYRSALQPDHLSAWFKANRAPEALWSGLIGVEN